MFGKKNNEDRGKVETIIGNGTKVEGDISTKGSLRVEGEVIGKIVAEGDLFIGEDGNINSQIKARKVIVAGKVKGNVVASDKFELLAKGELEGDIKSKVLKIEEGAKFVGNSKLFNEKNDPKISVKAVKNEKKSNKSINKENLNKEKNKENK
jgi:cytoskeletal protein CcmA (bactofilin family)